MEPPTSSPNSGTHLPLLPLTGPHRQIPSHRPGQSTAAWAAKGHWTREANPPRNGFGDQKAPLPGLWDTQAVFGASALTVTRRPSKREKRNHAFYIPPNPLRMEMTGPVRLAAGARLMAFVGRRNGC